MALLFKYVFHIRLHLHMISPSPYLVGNSAGFETKKLFNEKIAPEGLLLISDPPAQMRSICTEAKVKLVSTVISHAPCNLHFKASGALFHINWATFLVVLAD